MPNRPTDADIDDAYVDATALAIKQQRLIDSLLKKLADCASYLVDADASLSDGLPANAQRTLREGMREYAPEAYRELFPLPIESAKREEEL